MYNGEINIIYDIKRDDREIRIFGYDFVMNNRDKCKMIIDNKEYEISEKYYVYNNKNKLNIILKGINNITNMSDIFLDVHHYHLYLIFQNGILIMLLIREKCFLNVHHYHHYLIFPNGILIMLLI